MKSLIRHTPLRFAAAACVAALTLTACGGGAPTDQSGATPAPAASSNTEHSITFIPKQLNNPFSDVMLDGGKKAAEEIGFAQTNVVGPLDASASSQVSFLNAETQAGTNVIVLAANDPDAVCPALEDARKAGAKIVTFDSDANPKCRDIFVNQVVSKRVAITLVEMISEQIGGEGDIAILSATANATNQNEWIKFMEEELATNPDYSKINLVAKVYGDDDDTKSFQEAQGLLQAHPNLKGIVSPTTVGIAATGRYLSTSTYKGKVALTGLGLPNEMRSFVEDGTVTEFALWDPAQLGYVAAYAGAALASGEITGQPGDTFTAGELGPRTIEENGLVIVGDPLRFNKDNIANYNF